MNLPSFPNVDLFSAGINALYGVLVARNPSHNRGYTVAGLLIMAYLGGIGGGVTRDLLLNDIPVAAQGPGLSFRVPSDGFAGAGDLSLPRIEGGAVPYEDAGLLQVLHAALVCDPWRA